MLTPQQCWDQTGCVRERTPATEHFAALARAVTERFKLEKFASRQIRERGGGPRQIDQTYIAGQAMQTDLTFLRKKIHAQLTEKFRAYVAQRYAELSGKPWSKEMMMYTTKMLVSTHGSGEQMLHFDSTNYTHVTHEVTIVLYANQTHSTLMPRFYPPSLLPLAGTDATAADLRARVQLMEDKSLYYSDEVPAGTLLLFRHFAPHAGVQNQFHHSRILLFDMLGPIATQVEPNEQHFVWHYVLAAFGEASDEYLDCLIANWKHSPLEREDPAEGAMERIKPLVLARCALKGIQLPKQNRR